MFGGCTSLTTAPTLPATTLVEGCYYFMFHNCEKLNYVKAMFTDVQDQNNLSHWLNGVAQYGTFIKNADATWTKIEADIPPEWTVQTA